MLVDCLQNSKFKMQSDSFINCLGVDNWRDDDDDDDDDDIGKAQCLEGKSWIYEGEQSPSRNKLSSCLALSAVAVGRFQKFQKQVAAAETGRAYLFGRAASKQRQWQVIGR